MQQDIESFLNLTNTPGRLTAEQAAWFLGFSAHEIPILVAKGLLKPLGHPAPTVQSTSWPRRWANCGAMKSGLAKPRTPSWNTGATKTAERARTHRTPGRIPSKVLMRVNSRNQGIDSHIGASG